MAYVEKNEAVIVRGALLNTPADYMEKLLATRNPGPDARGSRFDVAQSKRSLYGFAWKEIAHPEVKAPARAFRAPIPGCVGVVALADLPDLRVLRLTDPKGTGFVEAEVTFTGGDALPRAAYTTIIVGPSQENPARRVVWTVFPGDPIAPSRVPAEGNAGRAITVREARALGLAFAKVATCNGECCKDRPAPSEATTLGKAIFTVAHLPVQVDRQGPLTERERRACDWAMARHNRAWEAWHAKCDCACHDQGE